MRESAFLRLQLRGRVLLSEIPAPGTVEPGWTPQQLWALSDIIAAGWVDPFYVCRLSGAQLSILCGAVGPVLPYSSWLVSMFRREAKISPRALHHDNHQTMLSSRNRTDVSAAENAGVAEVPLKTRNVHAGQTAYSIDVL